MVASDDSCIALWRVLFLAARSVEERVRHSTEASGLGVSDFQILEALRAAGALTVSALGERTRLTSGSMTTAIDRLSKRKLVARKANQDDARSRLVELLPAGKKLLDCAVADHAAAVSSALAGLSARERKQAMALLTKLIPT